MKGNCYPSSSGTDSGRWRELSYIIERPGLRNAHSGKFKNEIKVAYIYWDSLRNVKARYNSDQLFPFLNKIVFSF